MLVPPFAIMALSLFISSCKASIFSCSVIFRVAEFLIILALVTNFKVLIVSFICINEQLILATIVVLEFPPRESFKK